MLLPMRRLEDLLLVVIAGVGISEVVESGVRVRGGTDGAGRGQDDNAQERSSGNGRAKHTYA
jgi:hypothetical protein